MVNDKGKDTENSDEPITHIDFDWSDKPFKLTECDFSGHIFQGKANFRGTQFTGFANFEGATFKNGVSFSNARFHAGASFSETKFINEGDVLFEDARFLSKGGVSFYSTMFENDGNIDFHSARFENIGEVSFKSTRFANKGSVLFDSVTFENTGDVSFARAMCENQGIFSFHSARFENKDNVWFILTKFANEGDVSFGSGKFKNDGSVLFIATEFKNKGNVSFNSAKFKNKGDISFMQVPWVNDGTLNFVNAGFGDEINARFLECLFLCKDYISFELTRFPEKGSLVFQRCHFEPIVKVDFTGAFFRHTMFEGGEVEWISFLLESTNSEKMAKEQERAILELPVAVQELIKSRKEPFHTSVFHGDTVVLFKDLTTESAKHLTFRLTNLSRAVFDGMTLSHIQLNAPKWWEENGRSMLYEEHELRESHKKKPKYDRFKMYFSKLSDEKDMQLMNLENQYTQLKTNLERQGDYYQAGQFHYGEQEMRRLMLPWYQKYFGLTNIYRIVAGYGEKPLRALFCLALLILIAPLLIPEAKEMGSVTISCSRDYFQTVIRLITPFSWRNESDCINIGNALHYIPFILTQIVIYIQLPLLIMAVRRRFKR